MKSSLLHTPLRLMAIGVLLGAGGLLQATSLVDGFNVTVFNNFTSQFSAVLGTLEVGKNVNLTGYALNQSAPNPNSVANGFDTVVGGAFSFQSGSIFGPVSAVSATVTGSTVCSGCVVTGASPVDFTALEANEKNQSSFLYALSSTGTVTKPFSTLLLAAGGSSTVQVFSITSSQLSNNSGIDITGISPNTTVIVNVSDTGSHTASTSSSGLLINDQQVQSNGNVLFNFAPTITSISITNSFYSNMLAPYAAVSSSFGSFNGDLVASSYSGNAQFTLNPFLGALPGAPTSTPEPATFHLLAGVAVAAAGLFHRRRRSKLQSDTDSQIN
jgi:choice-of-anchor A domain-containing protein